MELFRLGNCKFSTDLSGQGSRLYGGRWNSVGVPAVYFATSRALAVLEVLVHLPPLLLPNNFCMAKFETELSFQEMLESDIPSTWNTFPFPKQLQLLGDQFFLRNQFPFLKVPSAIVEGEFNFILNPKHTAIDKITLIKNTPFSFDSRLF